MAVSLPLWVMLPYTRRPENQESARQSVIEQHNSNDTCGQIMPARLWLQGTQTIKFIQVFNHPPAPGATTRR